MLRQLWRPPVLYRPWQKWKTSGIARTASTQTLYTQVSQVKKFHTLRIVNLKFPLRPTTANPL